MLKPITPSRSSLTPVPSVISPFFLDETVAGGSWESSWREGRQRRLFWEKTLRMRCSQYPSFRIGPTINWDQAIFHISARSK